MYVIKNNGEQEEFSEKKVTLSIQRAGIPHDLQEKVLQHIKEKIFSGVTTSEIHNHIKEFLRTSSQPHFVVKYDLKRSIMELGPTGYPFEDYIARLLTHQGYTTRTRSIVRGKCIQHEIDVIAKKEKTTTVVEAKFHNTTGIKTDVHVALYTQARFEDIRDQNGFDEILLITNTQITSDARMYGECVGMKIVSWDYPEKGSLRDWIETMALYPITALTALTNSQKAHLMQNGIVLCQDICSNYQALEPLELSRQQKEEILAEATFACTRSC